MRITVLIAGVLASVLGGCSTVKVAQQVGGNESSTWVFIHEEGFGSEPGIYRCTETKGVPKCVRAEMNRYGK